MKKKKEICPELACRLNKVGGQAVLEGVMMKAGEHTVTTCRKESGELVVVDEKFVSVRQNNKFLNLPLVRGVVNFIEMMKLSFRTLTTSAEAMELDDEKDKQKKAEGKKTTTDFVMIIGMVLGVLLALALFIFLPKYTAVGIEYLFGLGNITVHPTVSALIEGVAKIVIFIVYLSLTSLMPDIKRTFMYHGAEHKSIACFEAGGPLTPENAKNYTRFHPRCGTSFMFFMILLGIIVGIILNNLLPEDFPTWATSLIRLALLPLVVGVGYEFIMFAGKHDNFFTRALSAPGLWVQRITTKEPTEDMLEVAITSIKCALRDEFDEFREFYENRGWIKEEEKQNAPEECGECCEAQASESTEAAEGECCEFHTEAKEVAPDAEGTEDGEAK